MLRFTKDTCAIALCISFSAISAFAELPPNHVDEAVGTNWDSPVGLTFASDGRLFVWEKAGRIWIVEDGQKAASPMLDISEEVGNYGDYGLLGFALHPNFYENGYIYLLYVVDYHHAKWFGTDKYDKNKNEFNHDTIGRVTRYTANASDGFRTVDPDSRKVLLGTEFSDGFPILHLSHGVGTIAFGEDGTLLVGCGDGASYNFDIGGPVDGSTYTGLQDGIIEPKEDIGVFRAQLVDSLSGKILRLDPDTGDGVASNPFFDPDHPRAKHSRVWALGLRNPYRFTLRPGSGDPDPSQGNPGVIYIGDVGWVTWEDLNVCTTGGQNFGWPVFEGFDVCWYAQFDIRNQDAPNPLYGQNGCDQQYFAFRDLTIQDTKAPSWPNPCDTSQQIPDDVLKFIHTRPAIDWNHAAYGPSRAGIFNGDDAGTALIGAPDSPVDGPQFGGNCSVGGFWYSGDNLPEEYHNTYFHAEYGRGWIRSFIFDDENKPSKVQDFGSDLGYIMSLAASPIDGTIYYTRFRLNDYLSEVRHIVKVDNQPPIAVATATPQNGPTPLRVDFDGSKSHDPEKSKLTYEWRYSDGQPISRTPKPVRFFPAEDITALGNFYGRIFELDPPHPTGGGNWDPETMRDGDYPPIGNQDPLRQFDTYHGGQQGSREYIGYTFNEEHEFLQLIFQEGMHFSDGGWFANLRVEYRKDGKWSTVSGYRINPTYVGDNHINYEMYEFRFNPVKGDGLRIYGAPGGSSKFISIGELRVLATPENYVPEPARINVKLIVTDTLRETGDTTIPIWLDDTAPTVTITSPTDGAIYNIDAPTEIALTADIADAEHDNSELTCRWDTILHHDDHVHFVAISDDCQSTTIIEPVGCDGDTYYYELRLTVTDPVGMSTTASAIIYVDPGCIRGDANCDGGVDFADIDGFVLALTGEDAYRAEFPHCAYLNNDIDCNHAVDFNDIDGFVDCLINGVCAPCP